MTIQYAAIVEHFFAEVSFSGRLHPEIYGKSGVHTIDGQCFVIQWRSEVVTIRHTSQFRRIFGLPSIYYLRARDSNGIVDGKVEVELLVNVIFGISCIALLASVLIFVASISYGFFFPIPQLPLGSLTLHGLVALGGFAIGASVIFKAVQWLSLRPKRILLSLIK